MTSTDRKPSRAASRDTWAAYADSLGIGYPYDAKRTTIIAAVDTHEAQTAAPSVVVPRELVEPQTNPGATIEAEVQRQLLAPAPDEQTSAPDLVVLIPSRGRPGSIGTMVDAWRATSGFDTAAMLWVLHADDPRLGAYADAIAQIPEARAVVLPAGSVGMAPQANEAARQVCDRQPDLFALAVLGDDHLPRTDGWAAELLGQLRDLGTGIVYGNDLLRGERLPTAWAMTTDIVRALGRAVPALVAHLYSDNAVLELGRAADCIRYLPDVVIEHMHPTAGKAAWDDGYRRVNGARRRVEDQATFERWRTRAADHPRAGLASQAALIRTLRAERVNG